MNPDIAVETSRHQSPKGKIAAPPSTATASGDRDSLFSAADEEHDTSSSTRGEDPSVYYTARTSSSLSAGQIPIRRFTERRHSGLVSNAFSEEFPHRGNLTRRSCNGPRLTAEEFSIGRNPDRRDSNLVYYASHSGHPLRNRTPSPDRSDLGSDSSSAVDDSLAENRRILNEGFERMAARQTTLDSIAEHGLVEQERMRSVVAKVAAKTQRSLESTRTRATTEQEAMQMLVEDVPFSADGRGHCDEAEVRRVALGGGRHGLMRDSPYPRMDRYHR
jgi:hypothetical protein